MAKFDKKNDYKALVAVPARSYSGDATFVGEPIDLRGYEACTFIFHGGVIADGTYTPAIYESDTGLFSGEETAVDDADLIGTEAAAALTASSDAATSKLGYIGEKRYVQARIVSSGVTGGGVMGAIAVLDHAQIKPVA